MSDTITPTSAYAKRVKRLWIFSDGQLPWAFDAVIRESHYSELVVTDNPVETGVVISDHAFMAPLRLEIEAQIGDFWLHAIGPGGQVVSDTWLSDAGRSVNSFLQIQGLQALAEPFSIQTGLTLYSNMLITTLQAEQDVATANVFRFRASLRQVIFVNTQTVTYPPRAPGPPAHKANKTVSSGNKTPTPPAPEELQSLLSQAGVPSAVQSLLSGGP